MNKVTYNPTMSKPSFARRLSQTMLDATGWFTIGVVAILSYVTIDDPANRWVGVGLCLAVAVLDFFWEERLRHRYIHFYFAAQVGLIIALFSIQIDTFVAPILFFILSAQAIVSLPGRWAAVWIGVFILVTGAFSVLSLGWARGLLTTLPYVGGYSFFAAFGKATREAQEARHETQRLLTELQAAQSQLKELTIIEERNRLARELHDSLGHRLTVAVVQLEGAQRLMGKDPERAARMIGTMREQMKEALADLRHSVATLRSPLTEDLPLPAALTQLAQEFQESTGLPVHLNLPAELPSLDEAQRLTLYRTAQESFTNAHKHAGAKNLWLNLETHNGQLILQVADDGVGLPANLNGSGFGLLGLRERAAQVNGQLELNARPGGGTQVALTLPLVVSDAT
jgi:signal transduction histidine kinase